VYTGGKIFDNSIQDLTTALQIASTNPQLLYKLGLSYYANKEWRNSVNTLKKALMCDPFPSYEADIYYHIGLSYCIQEKFEKAIYPLT
jgi:tetratricopeptide (TPR) repeat protein